MSSPQEQEEFLQHGRFGEGREDPTRNRGSGVRPAGLLLIIAGAVILFSPRFRLVEDIPLIAVVLGLGSAVSVLLAACERTGLGVLVAAGALLLIAVNGVLLGPAMGDVGLAGGAIGFFVFVCGAVSATLGGVVIIVGVVVDQK